MKITRIETLLEKGGSITDLEMNRIKYEIRSSIEQIQNPKNSGCFGLRDQKMGNGVRSIKEDFFESLQKLGWDNEKSIKDKQIKKTRVDGSLLLSNGKRFVVEWETGNISSSHRSLNRIYLGILNGLFSGGVLILPSRAMYKYLTDRIGNFKELEPYFMIWKLLEESIPEGMVQIIEIEHDYISSTIPVLPKGTDGRALI